MALSLIFIDTGAFVAADLSRDQFHQRSRQIWNQLSDSDVRLYSSDAVFQETIGLLHARGGSEFAIRWAEIQFQGKSITWLPVDAQVRRASLSWMRKYADQGVSFVDATSFALMRRENIRNVFSFDRHFAAAGFRLWPG
jgi:predicted nucleic acid-binding protein